MCLSRQYRHVYLAASSYFLTIMIALWLFGCLKQRKLSESAPSRTSGLVAVEAWPLSTNQGRRSWPSQDVCLIPENSPGSSWEKVSEQPVQQWSLSVPVAPLSLNEWGMSNYWSSDWGRQSRLQKTGTRKFGAREQIKAKRVIRGECGLQMKSPLLVIL